MTAKQAKFWIFNFLLIILYEAVAHGAPVMQQRGRLIPKLTQQLNEDKLILGKDQKYIFSANAAATYRRYFSGKDKSDMIFKRDQKYTIPKPVIVDPEYSAGKTEGDMVLTEEQKYLLANPMQARNGVLDESKRWPDRTVYYKIVGDFDAVHVEAIKDGMETIESKSCVKFREADDTQSNYVKITSKSGGCFTAVGYQARVQEMNLEPHAIGVGCFRPGSITHELMHALGFYHEQSASDRDAYIKVLYENIQIGKEFNFKKYTSAMVNDMGVGYDYESCMHYGPNAFSKNGEDTIVPLDPTVVIGQRLGLSKKDIDKINVMYKCPIKI